MPEVSSTRLAKIRAIADNDFHRLQLAIVYDDYYSLSKLLSSVKMNKGSFTDLCKVAISANNDKMLTTILSLYPVYWDTSIFNELCTHCMWKKNYPMLSTIDLFIDRANERIEKVNAWNSYVRESVRKAEEKKRKEKAWYNRLLKIFKFWK